MQPMSSVFEYIYILCCAGANSKIYCSRLFEFTEMKIAGKRRIEPEWRSQMPEQLSVLFILLDNNYKNKVKGYS